MQFNDLYDVFSRCDDVTGGFRFRTAPWILPFGPHPGAPPNPRSTASNEAPGDMDFPDQPWLIVVNNG